MTDWNHHAGDVVLSDGQIARVGVADDYQREVEAAIDCFIRAAEAAEHMAALASLHDPVKVAKAHQRAKEHRQKAAHLRAELDSYLRSLQ